MSILLVNADGRRVPLPDNSVDCVVTSPPYWKARKYAGDQRSIWGDGVEDCPRPHGWQWEASKGTSGGKSSPKLAIKGEVNFQIVPDSEHAFCRYCGAWYGELGHEPTPELFVAHLVGLFRDVRRVLKPTGQAFINIGDTRTKDRQWAGVPHKMAHALQADGWRWEDEIVWDKPNSLPGSHKNRVVRSHEYVFIMNKSREAYFDPEAVKVPSAGYAPSRTTPTKAAREGQTNHGTGGSTLRRDAGPTRYRRSVWRINTVSYGGKHFAPFPPELAATCIKAGTSERGVCSNCGRPWERKVHRESRPNVNVETKKCDGEIYRRGNIWGDVRKAYGEEWLPTCKCGEEPVPSLVLDPCCGSGTALIAARELGRDAIGLDISVPYLLDDALVRTELDKLAAWEHGKKAVGDFSDLPLWATIEEE